MPIPQSNAAAEQSVLCDYSHVESPGGVSNVATFGNGHALLNEILYSRIPGATLMPSDKQVIHPIYGQPIEILLVEDNPDDASLTVETLQEGRIRNNVSVVEDGVEAISFLRGEGEYADAPRPDLILLDLQLPRKNGREVLAEIKQDPELKSIPVVILTTSSAEKDVFETYNLHANCYVTKPVDLDEFIGAVRQIEDYWLTIVKLPRAAA